MIPEPPLLHRAAIRGDVHAVSALLDNGEEVDCAPNNGFTALAAAASYGQTEVVNLLVRHGADVNARGGVGRHVLLLAAWWEAERGDHGVVRTLLDAGADVNLRSTYGETALQGAAGFTNGLAIVQILLTRGAHVNVADRKGSTPLMRAAAIGQAEIVLALLAFNSDIDMRDEHGSTAQMIAAQYQYTEVVKLLDNAKVK